MKKSKNALTTLNAMDWFIKADDIVLKEKPAQPAENQQNHNNQQSQGKK